MFGFYAFHLIFVCNCRVKNLKIKKVKNPKSRFKEVLF